MCIDAALFKPISAWNIQMMLEQISIATRFPIAATVLLLALAACDTVDDSESIEVQKPAQEQKSTIKKVTVTQGTNFAVALSDDASTLAMSLQGVLFTLPASGGSATAITDYYQDAREPDWSPSNNDIAYYGYANGNWDLWLVPAAGGEPKALTTDSFDDREPRYSPDGSKIAFSSDRAGNYDIWVLDLNTRELTQVTSSSKNEYSPDWNPSGDSLAYATTQGRQASELRTITLSNGESQIVTKERGTISGISWRSSENLLSYQLATTNTTGNTTSVKAIRVDGAETETLSEGADDVFPFKTAWSKDGVSFYTANGNIYKQDRDSARVIIPFTAEFELNRPEYVRASRDYDDISPKPVLGISQPAISPAGEKITFAALGDLWLWQPETDDLSKITDGTTVSRSPAWSPTASKIAYVSDTSNSDGTSTPRLWLYDIETGKHTLAITELSIQSTPAWSPNGDFIAVYINLPGNPLGAQLIMWNVKNGEITNVGKPSRAQPISWSLDGEYLAATELAPYSSRFREGTYQLSVTSKDSKENHIITPNVHRNMTDAVLTPNGQGMTYIQNGVLWQQNLTEDFVVSGKPRQLTQNLTDSPAWSLGGHYLAYMEADRMKRLDIKSGVITDITPKLTWVPDNPDKRYSVLVGKLYDGKSSGYIENALITITGNRISSVQANSDAAEADIDASDKAAFPGLFEMHAHMGTTSATQGKAWLSFGVTTVRDPGAHPYVAKERQEMWDSGKQIGPRTHTAGFLTDGNRVYYSVAEGVTSDAHLERVLDRAARLELDLIKTYVRFPGHWQKRVVEFAHGIGIPTSSHELFPAVAHGMDHVEHIGGTSRRGYAPKVSGMGRSYNDVTRLISESGMGITPTAVLPGYTTIVGLQPDLLETPQFNRFYGEQGRLAAAGLVRMFGPAAKGLAKANGQLIRDLAATDALMVTGTDSPFVPYGAGLHAELRLFELAGLTPEQILHAATFKSAQAAGVAKDLGSISAGKIADIVLVLGDPLRTISDADNVTMTIKNGHVYKIEQLLE
jgi:Tol biopolymer transport system component